MSIKETLLKKTDATTWDQKDIDISEWTGIEGQIATIVKLNLGEKERLENFIKNNPCSWRAAWIGFCLYETNKDGNLERIFAEHEISQINLLPLNIGNDLCREVLRFHDLLIEDENTGGQEKN